MSAMQRWIGARRRHVAIALGVSTALVAVGVVGLVTWRGGPTAEARVDETGLHFALGEVQIDAPPGVAPIGTRATAREMTGQPTGAPFPSSLARGATAFALELDGLQPARPITISFPTSVEYTVANAAEADSADDVVPLLLSQSARGGPVQLEPASFDSGSQRVTVTVAHLTSFWEWPAKAEEFVGAVRDVIFLGDTRKPDCHGRSIADSSGREVTLQLPQRKSVWACLRSTDDGVAIDLTNTTPAPWELRAAPDAALQPQGATSAADALVLALIPRVNEFQYGAAPGAGVLPVRASATYEFPITALPAQVGMRTDPLAYLVSIFGVAIDEAGRIAGVNLVRAVLNNVAGLDCISQAASVAEAGRPDATAIGEVLVAMFGCVPRILATVGLEVGKRAAFVAYLLASGGAQLASGVVGALGQVLGPQQILIERANPSDGPCSSPEAFEQWIRVLDPSIFADGTYSGVATPENSGNEALALKCVEGHAIGSLVARADTDSLRVVLRPVEGYWGIATFEPGAICPEASEYPPAVLAEVCEPPGGGAGSGERDSLWRQWQQLNDVCRGGPPPGVDPGVDQACVDRAAVQREHFDLSTVEFLVAWQQRDAAAMRELAVSASQQMSGRTIPDDLLAYTPAEDAFGDCRYDVAGSGGPGCYMTVLEGGPGFYFIWEMDYDKGWLVQSYAPDV